MFKRLLRGIVLAATMSVPCMANAQNIDFIQDNLHYYIEGNSAAVSGDVDTVIDGSLIIPSHVSYDGITYIVTAILGFDYTGITSVSIPNTVTRIESGTFSHCTGLTSIIIPNSVRDIGRDAFGDCTNLTSVFFNADSCAHAGFAGGPFSGCNNITSFTFGNNVKIIPEFLCYGLTGLTSITIPDSVICIGNHAFHGCSNLTSVEYNAEKCGYVGIPHIINNGYHPDVAEQPAFWYSRNSITNFTIGASVKEIPAFLCYGLSNLTSVIIPDSVTSIGPGAFANCDSLASVTYNADSCYFISWHCSSIDDFYNYVNGQESSDTPSTMWPFKNRGVTNLVLGERVKKIPEHLCDGLNGLTSVTIPDSVTEIGDYAFRGSGLTSVVFPNSVRRINQWSFASTDITSLSIPSSVINISYNAFRDCNNLSSIEIDEDNTIYDSRDTCNAIVVTSDNSLIFGCKSTTIPNTVISIGEYAFYGCSGLKSITIPGSVNSFGYYTFYGCDSLTNVYMLGNYPPEILLESYYLEEQIFHNDATVHIPCNSINNYLSAYSRDDYGNYYYMWRRCNLIDPCSINRTITIVNNGGGYMQYRIGDNSFQDATDTVTVTVLDSSELRFRLYTILPGTAASLEFGSSIRLLRLLVNGSEFPLNSETCEIRDYSNDGGYIQYRVNMVVDTDMTIEVVFVPYLTVTVTAMSSDSTLGSVTGGGTYYQFDEVLLSACANVGSTFQGWSNGSTQNPLTLEVMSDTTLVAYFTGSGSGDSIFVLIHDTTVINVPYEVHDTTVITLTDTINNTIFDTVTLTEYIPVHDTTFVPVHDTSFVNVYDTTYIDVPYAVHDTTYIDVYIHDTTTVIDTLTLTEYIPVHDTTFINVHDTTYITVTDTVTNTVYDTINNYFFDTTVVYSTDTLWLHDTVFVHDTIYIYDTIVVGVDEVDAISAKVYTSRGQIVVDGAEGNTVWLYDVNGRLLATKQDEYSPLHFDVPASGAYMVKIGNHPARKVIVIR